MDYEENDKLEKVSIPSQTLDSLLESSKECRYQSIRAKKHFLGHLAASYLAGCCALFVFGGKSLLYPDNFSQGVSTYFLLMLSGLLIGAVIYGISSLVGAVFHDYKGSLAVPILVVLFLAPVLFFLFLFNQNPY